MDKVPTTTKLCKLLRESYVDWNQVIQICKTHKHYTKTKDWKHRTPLHIACLKHPPPPLNALKAIVKANRRALLLPDVDGMLPIHYVCKEGEDTYELLSMLGVLIRYCPESILIQDRKGCTPLHGCCQGRKGLEFFKCLLDADECSVTSGAPTVLILKDEMRRTALHFAVIHALDTEILAELIRAAPRTVDIECVRGYCPMHYACSYLNVGEAHIRLLLDENVRVSRLRGNTGWSCLELLTRTYKEYLDGEKRLRSECIHAQYSCASIRNEEEKQDFSDIIEQYWEKAILVAGGASLGRLLETNTIQHDAPLFIHDIIRLDRCPSTLISLALVKHPEWLDVKDDNGNLPLHTVASKFISRRCTKNHAQITRLLLRSHPDACREKNNDGKYPLVLAIESGKRWSSGLQDMLNAFPEAIDALDLDDRLYPFILSRASADVSKLHKLITLFPSIILS
jgi:ankyrin repeat protein